MHSFSHIAYCHISYGIAVNGVYTDENLAQPENVQPQLNRLSGGTTPLYVDNQLISLPAPLCCYFPAFANSADS